MKFWDDKDGNGNKLTDGRVCLVIQNPEMPEIRTYGKDREEVLDKLATTTETAQLQIHKMRKTPSNPAPAARPNAAAATDVARAVTELSDPTKAAGAVKTLLKAGGFDVDANAQRDAIRRVADIGQAWEEAHPEFPHDPRNQRMLIDRAIILAGGRYVNVTAATLDAAFEELTRQEMFFERVPNTEVPNTVQPEGTQDSRTVRNATSYRRNALRSAEPPPAPRGDSAKEARWRTILNGPAAGQAEAIRNEPGYLEWVDRVTRKSA